MAFSLRLPASTFFALAVAAVVATAANADTPAVRFRGIAEGMNEAQSTGKPVLLFFTAAWCTPCRELEVSVFSNTSFGKLIEDRFVPVEVLDRRKEDGANLPEVQALRENFNVTSFPTLVLFHVNGPAAIRQTGFASRQATFSFLRDAASRLEAAEKKAARAAKP